MCYWHVIRLRSPVRHKSRLEGVGKDPSSLCQLLRGSRSLLFDTLIMIPSREPMPSPVLTGGGIMGRHQFYFYGLGYLGVYIHMVGGVSLFVHGSVCVC